MKRIIQSNNSQNLCLRFPHTDIQHWAQSYMYEKGGLEDEIMSHLAPEVRRLGYLNKVQFLKVCEWKTSRSKSRCQKNEEVLISDITKLALTHKNERIRIESLTLLDGVMWPTASVLLHFFHPEPYPILDFRALWSLGMERPPVQYDFEFWWNYVVFCRNLSNQEGLDMRIVDRALWAYSSIHQKK